MQVTSAILLIAIDGKQQFYQVILEDEERKNLVDLISRGALTPVSKKIRVLDEVLIRKRRVKKCK